MQLQSENNPFRSNSLLYAGGHQPVRRDFGISTVAVGRKVAPVQTVDLAATPFFRLTEFSRTDVADLPGLLIVAPLSGHFPVLMRDLVLGLLPSFKVYVTGWLNVRHVSAHHGPFGFEDNISAAAGSIRSLPPGLTVIGLCQGGAPRLRRRRFSPPICRIARPRRSSLSAHPSIRSQTRRAWLSSLARAPCPGSRRTSSRACRGATPARGAASTPRKRM